MRRGLTLGETLVALTVLILFVAITLPIYHRVRSGTLEQLDTDRMRKIYTALTLYETENNGQISQNLLGVRSYLGDDSLLQSDSDPWSGSVTQQRAKLFPIDPEIPGSHLTSPIRISFSYMPNFVLDEKLKINLQAALRDRTVGLLTSGWHGDVSETSEPYTAKLFGPVLRIDTDGSLFRLPSRGGDGTMGDPKALFYKR